MFVNETWLNRRRDDIIKSEGVAEGSNIDTTTDVLQSLKVVTGDINIENESSWSSTNSSSFASQPDNSLLVPTTDKIYRLQPNGTEPEVLYYSGLPKFVQVWLTLITCTLLIAFTLILINRTKQWCRSLSCRKCGKTMDTIELSSEILSVTPSTSIVDEAPQSNSNSLNVQKDKCRNGHTPREHFLRRPSGPFGDDAIAYADETYQFRTKPAPTDEIRYLTNFKPWK